ncbi:2-methoxy-6-polyprenyl-1,4-benzoquinol methylase, mitochondrial [Sporomusa carbonis]|uniref:class I SAM-dependent methyltransferase n=1 Tax=Sporomusa carbonis TaxID=3076075 RepID=UPI003A776CD6
MVGDACFFDRIAADWDATRAADEEKISRLVNMIGLGPGARVLDAGSGTGILLPFIKNITGSQGQITAVDFSAKMLAIAQAKYAGLGGIEFVVADIMSFMTDNLYDAIVCFNFFPHIKDKHLFFQHMRNILVEKGILTIMHDLSREQVNAIHGGTAAVQDDRLAAAATVCEWLTAAGYNVVNVIDGNDCYFIKAAKSSQQ